MPGSGHGARYDTSGRNGTFYTIDQNGQVLLLVAMVLRGPVHKVTENFKTRELCTSCASDSAFGAITSHVTKLGSWALSGIYTFAHQTTVNS